MEVANCTLYNPIRNLHIYPTILLLKKNYRRANEYIQKSTPILVRFKGRVTSWLHILKILQNIMVFKIIFNWSSELDTEWSKSGQIGDSFGVKKA